MLYAPRTLTREEIAAIVDAVSPKPVNVLVSTATGFKLADLAEMGVRRVSVGSALSVAAWSAFIRAAKAIVEDGSFEGFASNVPFAELNSFFVADVQGRG